MDRHATINVMLADDYDTVRAATHALLRTFKDLHVVTQADPAPGILPTVLKHRPDVLLLDIGFPNEGALEIVKSVSKKARPTRVLVLSMYAGEKFVQQALKMGASGYLLYQSAASELEESIRAVAAGELYLSRAIASPVTNDPVLRNEPRASGLALTPRHIEILRLVALGNSSKQIALQLAISPKTVEVHRAKIMRRLNIHDLCGLVRYAIRVGLIGVGAE